jgi:type I restriction enzyme S subunit
MSETLEAMARALFKSWFVDFDPVRLPAGRQAPREQAPPFPKPGKWCVYALECDDGSIYIGHTDNLERRFEEHSKGKGADWTKRHPPKRVAFWERCDSQMAAIEREKKLKTGSGREWLKLEIARRDIAEGLPQPPCLPHRQVADLFPGSFEDSELGEIPEGWEVGTLGDVAEHPRRSVRPEQIEPETPYIALEHMPKQCIALSHWGAGEALESNKFEFKRGEILFGKLRPYFHKVGVAPVDGVCSTDIVVVAPRSASWFGFTLGHVSSTGFVDYTNAGSTGTKMPRTSWADMARYELVLPPPPVAEAFTRLVRPSVDRIIAGSHQSRTLAALRDALLPKLISGELRVKNAEKFLGGAV